MQRWIVGCLALALALSLGAVRASAQMGGYGGGMSGGAKSQVLLAFKTMWGVDGPFIGSDALRGIPGDLDPWVVSKSVKGSLTSRGKLSVTVKGLVFPKGDARVPPNLQGTNDDPSFRAAVSCLAIDNTGAMITTNVMSDKFAATPTGNAKIKAQLALPQPCIAPIVMILSGEADVWFATTGF